MPRLPLLILSTLLLSGCKDRLLPSETEPEPVVVQTCQFNETHLQEWLKQEYRFISSTLSDKRALLVDAERRQQVLYALLLSSPGQSQAQLERAIELLGATALEQIEECSAEQYLAVRQRQLTLQLELLHQIDGLQMQKKELERQVNALTDLERQITRQREEH